MTLHRVMRAEELWIGERRGVHVDGRPVLLVNVDGQILAYADRCAHRGVPLSDGHLEGHVLTCSAHGWTYDVRTGRGVNPSAARLREYSVKVEDGDLFVELDELPGAPR